MTKKIRKTSSTDHINANCQFEKILNATYTGENQFSVEAIRPKFESRQSKILGKTTNVNKQCRARVGSNHRKADQLTEY